MPLLRRAILVTSSPEKGGPFYKGTLGMRKFEQNPKGLIVMTTAKYVELSGCRRAG